MLALFSSVCLLSYCMNTAQYIIITVIIISNEGYWHPLKSLHLMFSVPFLWWTILLGNCLSFIKRIFYHLLCRHNIIIVTLLPLYSHSYGMLSSCLSRFESIFHIVAVNSDTITPNNGVTSGGNDDYGFVSNPHNRLSITTKSGSQPSKKNNKKVIIITASLFFSRQTSWR